MSSVRHGTFNFKRVRVTYALSILTRNGADYVPIPRYKFHNKVDLKMEGNNTYYMHSTMPSDHLKLISSTSRSRSRSRSRSYVQ